MSAAGWPARYEVQIDGVLEAGWSEWFGGMRLDTQGGQTVLSGTVADQPALHGILDKVRDLGLSVISVRRLGLDEKGGSR